MHPGALRVPIRQEEMEQLSIPLFLEHTSAFNSVPVFRELCLEVVKRIVPLLWNNPTKSRMAVPTRGRFDLHGLDTAKGPVIQGELEDVTTRK